MYYIAKFFVRLFFRIIFNLHYEGRDNIPRGEAVIYASNHRSNADPPLLGGGAVGKYAFMAKEELFRNKLFAWLIRTLGAFPVSRGKGDMSVIETAIDRLGNGRSLMIFPEGTRSKDGKVGRGHSGAALIAAKADRRIVPVGIVYGDKLKFRTRVTVKFGKPIDPKDYVEPADEPNPRQLVKLKNRYMADIKELVEGTPEPKNKEEKENA
ncbi:1-acyl-sn-glycerol-3-phosphate acyltransferase [Ruminococcus sp. YRD2003]|uniref:lysophospholipid acyltransferase family protein n=1 Tax=Ruminococcus sp. YRD2003 TaxID=1452313 RepID=UPI0008CBA25C|nr:1-acyl-sn-glycerol-3-phosphate acyltransferase [Ruminococcus flavefaciens]